MAVGSHSLRGGSILTGWGVIQSVNGHEHTSNMGTAILAIMYNSSTCVRLTHDTTRCISAGLFSILPVPESTECGDCCVIMWWVSCSPSTAMRVLTPGWHHSLPSSDAERDCRCCCQLSLELYGVNRLLCPKHRRNSTTLILWVRSEATMRLDSCGLRKRQRIEW